ncbi:MAG: potassium channel family protein [bacterium]
MASNDYECRDWKADLTKLLEEVAAAAAEGNAPRDLRKRFRAIWREARRCEEAREATRYTERGIAYARRLLIAADLQQAARRLYPEQLLYRRVSDRLNGRWGAWAAEYLLWLVAGHGQSAAGLGRLFVFIVVVVLGGFALLYRYPETGIEYQFDDRELSWYHYVYFSGNTLTTLGSGEILPKEDRPDVMFLVIAEGIIGYVLLGTFIFAVVTYRRRPPPPEDDWEEKLFARLRP